MKDMDSLVRQVKHNCNISDAKFWGYYSICGLLMRYRELYRSEHSLLPWDAVDNKQVISWIQERELLWQDLEDQELKDLFIEGVPYDPFDVNNINLLLGPSGLVYGGGYATFNKPSFFVARLDAVADILDYRVHHAGEELCRDLSAAPAMLQGRCIYVRPAALSVYIWDRLQELKAKSFSSISGKMFADYGIQKTDLDSPGLFSKVLAMTDDAGDIFVLHEIGEAYEDAYSEDWHEILGSGCDKATELYLRAVKDLLADTSSKGPLRRIVDGRNGPRLSFFVAFMDGIRKEIFPEITEAFRLFAESGDWSVIHDARIAGYRRAERLQADVVELWKKQKDTAALAAYIRNKIRSAVNTNCSLT